MLLLLSWSLSLFIFCSECPVYMNLGAFPHLYGGVASVTFMCPLKKFSCIYIFGLKTMHRDLPVNGGQKVTKQMCLHYWAMP